jgi:hypothetical protein
VLPLSLPLLKRSVPRIGEEVDVEIDDAITAMAIAAEMPNFIAFFNSGTGRHAQIILHLLTQKMQNLCRKVVTYTYLVQYRHMS